MMCIHQPLFIIYMYIITSHRDPRLGKRHSWHLKARGYIMHMYNFHFYVALNSVSKFVLVCVNCYKVNLHDQKYAIKCSSYIALFLAKVTSKLFTNYYRWQTWCYIHDTCSTPSGEWVHAYTHFKSATGTCSPSTHVQFPSLSIARYMYLFMAEWNAAHHCCTLSPCGTFFDEPPGLRRSGTHYLVAQSNALTIQPLSPNI